MVFGAIKINGTSLSSDDSTVININDGLIVDGTLNVLSTANTGTLTAGTGSTFGNLNTCEWIYYRLIRYDKFRQ